MNIEYHDDYYTNDAVHRIPLDSISENTWHRLTVVVGQNSVETYFDCLSVDTTIFENENHGYLTFYDIFIGDDRMSSGARRFDGMIDEVAIYGKALSFEEIMFMANNTPNGTWLPLNCAGCDIGSDECGEGIANPVCSRGVCEEADKPNDTTCTIGCGQGNQCVDGTCECVPTTNTACFEMEGDDFIDVAYIDSCGQPYQMKESCSPAQECALNTETGQHYCQDCISHDGTICFTGDVYWRDSCLNRQELKEDCVNNDYCDYNSTSHDHECCTTHAYRDCHWYSESVYWYNSCGQSEQLIENCPFGSICDNGYCDNCSESPHTFVCINPYIEERDGCGNFVGDEFCEFGCDLGDSECNPDPTPPPPEPETYVYDYIGYAAPWYWDGDNYWRGPNYCFLPCDTTTEYDCAWNNLEVTWSETCYTGGGSIIDLDYAYDHWCLGGRIWGCMFANVYKRQGATTAFPGGTIDW